MTRGVRGSYSSEKNRRSAKSHRALQEDRARRGLCIYCGIAEVVGPFGGPASRKGCPSCLEKRHASVNRACAALHARRREAGLCVRCGKNRAELDGTTCGACRTAVRDARLRRIERERK